jgi:hypothetical protein
LCIDCRSSLETEEGSAPTATDAVGGRTEPSACATPLLIDRDSRATFRFLKSWQFSRNAVRLLSEGVRPLTLVELPHVGKQVKKGGVVGVIESVKAASDLYSPISGELV